MKAPISATTSLQNGNGPRSLNCVWRCLATSGTKVRFWLIDGEYWLDMCSVVLVKARAELAGTYACRQLGYDDDR